MGARGEGGANFFFFFFWWGVEREERLLSRLSLEAVWVELGIHEDELDGSFLKQSNLDTLMHQPELVEDCRESHIA